MPIGFTLPFSKSTGSIGYFETTEGEVAAVREDLKSLLLTNWGERVNHYFLGCNFKEFLFETLHADELKSRMADRVTNQVETWLPFVVVQNLNILLSEDDPNVPENGVKVNIEFGLVSKPDLSSRLEVIVTQ
jgi:phage baseplate assembly protein W